MTNKPEGQSEVATPKRRDFVAPPQRSVRLSIICVMLAMLLAALSQTVIATLLPLMIADLGEFKRYTWAANSYIVASTVVFPIVGRLSDIYGRRLFLIVGMVIFMIGSALVGIGASMTQVVAFRAIQGIGGGIIMTCCYVSIADLFPPEDRGKYHGLIGAVFGVACVAGPVLGGFVAEHFSWQWAFILIAMASIPVLGLVVKIYPASQRAPQTPELDLAGMIALMLAVIPILSALSLGGVEYAWDAPLIIGLLAFGLAMSGLFIVIESRASTPIMPLQIYADRMVGLAVIVTLLTSLGLYGSVLFLPLFFQVALAVSATVSGNLLIPMLLGMVIGGIVSGQLISRTGGHYRSQALAGTGLMTVGMYLLSTMDQTTSLLVSVLHTLVAGLGFGGTVATLSVAVQNTVPFALVGAATSALQFFRSLGGMLGIAVLGVIMTSNFYSTLDEAIPDDIRRALPQGGLEALTNDPAGLSGDLLSMESLKGWITQSGADGDALAGALRDSLVSALTQALNDVFSIIAVFTALSFLSVVFLSMRLRSATKTAQ